MEPVRHLRSPFSRALPIGLCTLAAACGGGGSGGGGSTSAPQTHEHSLNRLGVDTSQTPRVDAKGRALPPDYSPFGKVHRIDPVTELWFGGMRIGTNGPIARLVEDIGANTPNAQGFVTPTVLHTVAPADMPWLVEEGIEDSAARSLRDGVAADLDGDGAEELVLVHFESQQFRSTIVRRDGTAYATANDTFRFNLPAVVDVCVEAGDFDGDGDAEIAVGYATANEAWLELYDWDGARLDRMPGLDELFHRQFTASQLELVLAAGRLDYDAADELVVVVNERTPAWATTTRYHVFDDAKADLVELQSGLVASFSPTQGVLVATLTDVALGDLDGDRLDEIVFGGLETLSDNCDGVHYVGIVLDDAAADFESLGARAFEANYPGCDQVDEYQLVLPHVNVLDLDGDGYGEIQLDRFVYDDLVTTAPWTEKTAWALPFNVFLDPDLESWLDTSDLAVATGDFDSDGWEEILLWRPQLGELHVYGLNATGAAMVRSARIALPWNQERFLNPLLVAVDTDLDSPMLVPVPQGDQDSTLVFHEPIVLAALAAPPCKSGIAQNHDACTTTFGNTTSIGTEEERSVTYTAGASIGFNVEGGALTQSEFDLKVSLEVAWGRVTSHSYEVSKTVSFITGPSEDTVVFTTTPMDRYVYRIAHHPEPDMVGKEVVVAIPREPLTLQVERSYYNANVAPGGLRIDDDVFQHVIGDPESYPSAAEKAHLLQQNDGEELGPQSVGQGGGATELEIEIANSYGVGGSLEIGFEVELEVTVGSVLGGVSFGASEERTFTITSGTALTYTGAVGSISASDFAPNQYSFGLFTYVQRDSATGQEFEVINYWVE